MRYPMTRSAPLSTPNPYGMGQAPFTTPNPYGMGAAPLTTPNPMALAGGGRMTLGLAPVGWERTVPGAGGMGQMNMPQPLPQGMPNYMYYNLPAQFGGTPGYKDYLSSCGLEFHTEWFDLGLDPVAQSGAAIPAGATVIANVRITQEADFVAEAVVADAAPIGADFSVQVFDNATNRALSNVPIRVANLAGTAQRIRRIKPRLFRRNSDLTLTFTNTGVNPITALQWVFQGYKIFDANALNLNNPQ